jgi:hypothetical protein
MKKSILGLSVFIALSAYASDFNVIISKENNSYEVAKGYIIVTETTNWTTLSNICSETTPLENIYFGVSVNEDIVCQDYQERDKITKKVYNNGTEKILSTETESQYVDTSRNTVTLVGTHKEDNCLNIQTFDNTLPDGQYSVFIDNSEIHVLCDMTTDGGGWTKVARVNPKGTRVVESNSWQSIHNLSSASGSHALKYLAKFNPQNILFKNTSVEDYYGENDLIIVSRTTGTWNWTPYTYNNNSQQTARFYDASANSWNNLGNATYASHEGEPWQSSSLSFTINGVQNGYRSEQANRLIVGPTYSSSASSFAKWFNFYGNDASSVENSWTIGTNSDQNATGEVWMK